MTTEVFHPLVDPLKEALNHLYEPEILRRSPLIAAAGMDGQPNGPFDLQQRLVDAIQTLKPPKGEAPASRAWRLYYALFYCFVQQFSQAEAATQMGISVRQLRRDQQAAIETLALVLVSKFHFKEPAAVERPVAEPARAAPAAAGEPSILDELSGEHESALDQVIPPLLDTLRLVIEKYSVSVRFELQPDLPPIEVHPVVLRQILLSLINHVLRQPETGQVTISADDRDSSVEIALRCQLRGAAEPLVDGLKAAASNVDASTAGYLTGLAGGVLEIVPAGEVVTVRLRFPSVRKSSILVIDDNLDLVHLLRRYVVGTRFTIVGAQTPEEIFPLAERYQPRVILLDIMMPRMDGWEVLSRLRQHPVTANVMILICSILNEPSLAMELGASGFLRKPVNRQEFLSLLERLSDHPD